MDFVIPFIVGWCGTGWPWHPRIPGGGGGGGGDDPWPINCIVCGRILGGIAAVILEMVLARQLANAGFGGHLAVDFFAGSFAVTLVGGLLGMMSGNRTVTRA